MAHPSSEAIAAFAAQIGLEKDSEFLWMAEVGLCSPLPPRWDSHVDDSGFVYYVDRDTQESTWENPLVPYLKQVVWIAYHWAHQQSEEWMNEQIANLWAIFKEDLAKWHGPYEAEGGRYYINAENETSSWEDPRVDAQYLFELQCGLLSKVQEIPIRKAGECTPGFGDGQGVTPRFSINDDASQHGEKVVPHRGEKGTGSPFNRLPSSTGLGGNALDSTFGHSAAAAGGASQGVAAEKPVSLQELRKKLLEQLGQVDLEQADEERRTVAASMTEQLKNLHNFLQNEQDTLEVQLHRKKYERLKKIMAHQEKKKAEAKQEALSPGSKRNIKSLSIDTNAPRLVTRKFKRAAFSRMMLEELRGPPALPSPTHSRRQAPPVPAC